MTIEESKKKRLKRALEIKDMESWIRTTAEMEMPKTQTKSSFLENFLFIAGFFTFFLTWKPMFKLMDRDLDNYIKNNSQDLVNRFYIEYEKYSLNKKRQQMKLQNIPSCPHCASDKISVFSNEYGKPKMVCKLCGKVFNPGE